VRFPAYCGVGRGANFAATRAAWRAMVGAETFEAFGASALSTHGAWHRAVGGAVACVGGSPLPGDFENARASVNDPAFFLAHAGLDAALDAWLARRPAAAADATRALRDALGPCRATLARRPRAAALLDFAFEPP